MITNILKSLFGSRNERILKQLHKTVEHINALEPEYQKLSDKALRAKTDEFRTQIKDGKALNNILPEAFAAVREAAVRTIGLRHYDMQMVGGMVLNDGNIAEMQTGEGKTLVATLPSYLNALSGEGVHIITVNDYLAKRDAEWMQPIYEFLGLTVGVVIGNMDPADRKMAYQADITYGTNNEFGFDYLRDNMAFTQDEKVQRNYHYAIVDEVDSILIDEARTPLIISGAVQEDVELYRKVNTLIPSFKPQLSEDGAGDYTIDEKDKRVSFTEDGQIHAEKLLVKEGLLANRDESLYHVSNMKLLHHLNAALRANVLFKKDVDYVVRDGDIIIVDEHTGRAMPGRRWSDGLHQAVEAKEGVNIQQESQTLASITLQNYFRMYEKLSGMTGTADTEAEEFQKIYNLEVTIIPANKPCKRKDFDDQIFLTQAEKFHAVIEDIKNCLKKDQPVLVGTASIEVSAYLSERLKKEKIKHQVLNAKFHEKEAHIIAQAGKPGAVTIATNMAGRGTDIVLGGNVEFAISDIKKPTKPQIEKLRSEAKKQQEQVLKAGGLHIVSTERHESRRIDNQLRGRSGRQGDPGSTRFYLSLEDSLMRIFASDKLPIFMKKLGMGEGEAIEHPWINRAIEHAQRKVEGHNFDMRKQLLEYDDVANEQRQIIYQQRNEMMASDDISDVVGRIRADVMEQIIDRHMMPKSIGEQWDIVGLEKSLAQDLALTIPVTQWVAEDEDITESDIRERIFEQYDENYRQKEAVAGKENMRHFEKAVVLQWFDQHWREHLSSMEYLLKGIGLRSFAQKNPKQEYKREAFEMFSEMLENTKFDVAAVLSRAQIQTQEDAEAAEEVRRQQAAHTLETEHQKASTFGGNYEQAEGAEPFVRKEHKQGRNDTCACGSGKKYKHCHGRITETV